MRKRAGVLFGALLLGAMSGSRVAVAQSTAATLSANEEARRRDEVLAAQPPSEPAPRQLTPEEEATRRELVLQAQREAQAGRHAEGLALAMRAGQLRMTPSLRMFIADRHRALGQSAPALGMADRCMSEIDSDPTVPDRASVRGLCQQIANAVRPLVARLTVNVATPPPNGLKVLVGGTLLSSTLWNAPYIVTPGEVLVEAAAPGYRLFQRRVSLAAAGSATVTVTLEAEPSAAATGTTAGATSAAGTARGSSRAAGGIGAGPPILLATGAVGMGLGVAFVVLRDSAVGQLEAQCDPPDRLRCPNTPSVQSAYSSASTYSVATGVAFGLGAVAVAGGIAWLVVKVVSRPRSDVQARVMPSLGPGWVGVVGRW